MRFHLFAVLGFLIALAGCQIQESQSEVVASKQEVAPQNSQAFNAPDLVNGKNEVGHRNFNSAKKILPKIFEGMEFE